MDRDAQVSLTSSVEVGAGGSGEGCRKFKAAVWRVSRAQPRDPAPVCLRMGFMDRR